MSDDPERSLVVAHHHPGRLRVRATLFETDPQLRLRAIAAVSAVEGVTSAVESATGSVLVEYDAERVDAGALVAEIASATALSVAVPPPPRPPAHAVFEFGRTLDTRVAEWTDGRFGLRVAVPAVLAAGSVASFLLSAHRRAPRWDNLLYWGFTIFRTLNEERAAREHADVRR